MTSCALWVQIQFHGCYHCSFGSEATTHSSVDLHLLALLMQVLSIVMFVCFVAHDAARIIGVLSFLLAIGFVLQSTSFERPWGLATWMIAIGFVLAFTLGLWLALAIWRADRHGDD